MCIIVNGRYTELQNMELNRLGTLYYHYTDLNMHTILKYI